MNAEPLLSPTNASSNGPSSKGSSSAARNGEKDGSAERANTARSVSAMLQPRGIRRSDASRYVGVSATKFDQLVKDGRMPKPKKIDGCLVWDRLELDQAFEALDGVDHEPKNDWDDVL